MVGCSKGGSSSNITSDGNSIYIKNKPTKLTYFDGTEGGYKTEDDIIEIKYHKCVEAFRDCPENRQGVHEADLSDFKKSKYFDAYINTYSVMHLQDKDITKEATISTENKDIKPLDSVRKDVYDTLNLLKFEPVDSSIFNDSIIVKGNGQNIIVRNTDITIPGVLTVFKGTKEVTQQVEIGDVTCMLYESNNFNFYQYGDSLIKIGKDYNVSDYIELKKLDN